MAKDGKARIIEAAKRVISKSGITGATLREIALEADLSTGAIYHYYKSKEEILYDVMNESLSQSSRIAREAENENRSKERLIEEIYDNILKRFDKYEENRIQFYLSQEAILGNEELKNKFKEKYSEWIDKTEELIKKLYGTETNSLSRAFASLLIGAIDGIAIQILLGANSSSPEVIAKVYKLLLLEGIPKFEEYLTTQK